MLALVPNDAEPRTIDPQRGQEWEFRQWADLKEQPNLDVPVEHLIHVCPLLFGMPLEELQLPPAPVRVRGKSVHWTAGPSSPPRARAHSQGIQVRPRILALGVGGRQAPTEPRPAEMITKERDPPEKGNTHAKHTAIRASVVALHKPTSLPTPTVIEETASRAKKSFSFGHLPRWLLKKPIATRADAIGEIKGTIQDDPFSRHFDRV